LQKGVQGFLIVEDVDTDGARRAPGKAAVEIRGQRLESLRLVSYKRLAWGAANRNTSASTSKTVLGPRRSRASARRVARSAPRSYRAAGAAEAGDAGATADAASAVAPASRMFAREVVVNAGPGVSTLTHELVHAIMQADFPDAPAWLNEGLGALFERPVFAGPGEIHGAKNWRYPGLVAALASDARRSQVSLEALFGMNDAQFHEGDEDLHYAMARYTCQWLDARGELWAFYAAWRDGVLEDPSGRHTFERVVGMTAADANDAWIAWLRGL
jgi:hypothetical protein